MLPLRKFLFLLAGVMGSMFIHQAFAQSVIDPDAKVVYLRKSCSVGTSYVDNCFESTTTLTNWLWGSGGAVRTNQPASNDRVHVEMGAGDFEPFECPGQLSDNPRKGYVSVHGAGREASRFLRTSAVTTGIFGAGLEGVCRGAIHLEHCDGLEFSNIGGVGLSGAFWLGAGKGVWNNVDLIGEPGCPPLSGPIPVTTATGWYDLPDQATEKSLQYFFGGRIWVKSGASIGFGLDTLNSEMWLYGSDVAFLRGDASGGGGAVFINDTADVRMFGGTVRVAGDIANGIGVWLQGGAFHMHGGIISLNTSGAASPGDLKGIYVTPSDSPVVVHTPGTAFVLVGGATAKRIVYQPSTYAATIMSPFLWQPSETPPQAGENSLHGQDVFVDTSANGTSEAHLMVRDDTCSGNGGPWRDMASGQCRVQ